MDRRTFVYTAAGAIVDLCHSLRNAHAISARTLGSARVGNADSCIFVSPNGDGAHGHSHHVLNDAIDLTPGGAEL